MSNGLREIPLQIRFLSSLYLYITYRHFFLSFRLSLCLWYKDGERQIKERESPTVMEYNENVFYHTDKIW